MQAKRQAKGGAAAGAAAASEESTMQLMKKKREYVVTFKFPSAGSHAGPVLGLHAVTFGYAGAKGLIFEGIDFGVDMETRAVIVGDNGAGKSTLLKLLSGVY